MQIGTRASTLHAITSKSRGLRRTARSMCVRAVVLKNAFDSAFVEWRRKPNAFVGYGGVGGARAIETLRGVVIELQMASIRQEVNIAMEPYLGIIQNGRSLNDYDYLVQSRKAMFDD